MSKILKSHNSLVGDSNIDLIDPSKDSPDYLSELLDAFNLKNIYREPICLMPTDVSLTSKTQVSQKKTQTFEEVELPCSYKTENSKR